MKITSKTLTQLIIQDSFASTCGFFLTSIALLIIGLVIFVFPELSHNTEERKEVSMSLTAMGAIGLTRRSSMWKFDKDDSCFVVTSTYLLLFKRSRSYTLAEIKEVILESETDDGIKAFNVKLFTQDNKEIAGFSN